MLPQKCPRQLQCSMTLSEDVVHLPLKQPSQAVVTTHQLLMISLHEWTVKLQHLVDMNADVTINAAGASMQALTFQRECEQQPAALCSSSTHPHLFLLWLLLVCRLLASWCFTLSPLSVIYPPLLLGQVSDLRASLLPERALIAQIVQLPFYFLC